MSQDSGAASSFAGGEHLGDRQQRDLCPRMAARVTLTLALSGKVWSELMLTLPAVITHNMFLDDIGLPIATHHVRVIVNQQSAPRALMHFRVEPQMQNAAGAVDLSVVVLRRPLLVNGRLEFPHLYHRQLWFDRRKSESELRLAGGSGHRKW